MSAKWDALTPKQKLFCTEYVKDYNGPGAYQRAGLPGQRPKKMAEKYLASKAVVAYLKEFQYERDRHSHISINVIERELWNTYQSAKGDGQYIPAIRALELLGKQRGMFVERHSVTHRLEVMSDDELIRELDQLREDPAIRGYIDGTCDPAAEPDGDAVSGNGADTTRPLLEAPEILFAGEN